MINDIKNKKNTRKNTIEKLKNIVSDLDHQMQNESTVFQYKMIEVVCYLFNSLWISSQRDRLMLPEWVKENKKIFNEILSTVTKAKNKGLRTNIDRREITLDNTESLLKNLGNGILDRHEFKNRYNDIANDAEVVVNRSIITRNKKSSKKYVTVKRNSETQQKIWWTTRYHRHAWIRGRSCIERRNQQRQGLKILTPDQTLSRLPILLARLKKENISLRLVNEIRQLLCSLYDSKKFTKTTITI